MPVVIIKEGRLASTVYRRTCEKCKAVIECLHSDFKFEGPSGTGWVKCPTPKCEGRISTERCVGKVVTQ